MFCSKCGHRISPNEKFCGNCGAIAEAKKETNPVKENKPKYQVIDPKKPTFDNKVDNKPVNKGVTPVVTKPLQEKVENKPVNKAVTPVVTKPLQEKAENKPVNKGVTPIVTKPLQEKVENKPVNKGVTPIVTKPLQENKPIDKKIEVKPVDPKVAGDKKEVAPNTGINQIKNENIKAPLKTDNKFSAIPQKPIEKPKEENKFEARKDNVIGIKPQSTEIKHETKEKAFSAIEKNTLQPRVDEKEEPKKIVVKPAAKEEKSKRIVIPMAKINSLNETQKTKKKEPETIENKTIIVPLKESDRIMKPPASDFTLGVQKDLDKTSTLRVEPPKKENDLQDLVVPPTANAPKPATVATSVTTPNTVKVDAPKPAERPKKKKGGILKYAFVVLLIMLITGGITYTLMAYQHNKELALQQENAVDTVYANGFTYKVPQSLEYKVNNEGLVVSNKEDTWVMSITAKKVAYQSLKADPQTIKTNYENNGCTASNQKNVTLKNREFMTFEVTCNNENTLVVYTKANDEFTYGVDIRNSDNTFDDSQLSTLATILNQSDYTEEKYLAVEDTSVNGIGLTSFFQTEVTPEPPVE